MSNEELIEKFRLMVFESVHNDESTMLHEAADALEAKAAPVGEREAGAAHDLAVKAFQAGAAYQRQSDWQSSGADYDRAVHSNPDAKAWADLFVSTFPALTDKHDLMLGWFANAMMAMHDFLKAQKRQSEVVMPERKPIESLEFNRTTIDVLNEGWNACLDEFARLNGAGNHE